MVGRDGSAGRGVSAVRPVVDDEEYGDDIPEGEGLFGPEAYVEEADDIAERLLARKSMQGDG